MAKSKYIYVEVTFISNSQRYSYRADNVTVHVGDVVVVPTPKGDNFATVERIRRFTDKNASYPPEQTKNIVKVVGHRIRTNLSDVDMRAPMDISTTVKKTLFGEKTVVISRKERDALRSRFARSNMRLVEYYPVSMVGQVVRENGKQIIPPPNKPEDQQGKPAKWLLHSHLFSKEYECSYCHVCYDNHFSISQ